MARMIPRWAHDDAPASERRVFEEIERDPAASTWTVLHALGLAQRPTGPYGEIDFVVIAPGEGIVCLEVKGGRVSCENGIWQTENRHGKVSRLKKSPFMQAKENMFALRDAIRKHFGDRSAEFPCPMAYAVVFPDVTCPPLPLSPEVDRAEVIDRDNLLKSISDSVVRCARHTRRKSNHREPVESTPGTVKKLLQFLRPDFDVVVTKQTRIGRLEDKQVRLTEEQFLELDKLEDNDRCLLTGGAGTGKTLLAAEYARREARKGARVLFVCFNQLLGGWIRRLADTTEVTAGNWHSITSSFARRSSLKDEFGEQDQKIRESGSDDLNEPWKCGGDPARMPEAGLDETYAYYGILGLEEQGVLFDVLVVDEAQDLLWSPHVCGFLDAALRDGLTGGRWAIFGDFNRQAIRPNVEPVDSHAILSDYQVVPAKSKLFQNCRNSRSIAEATAVVTGVETGSVKQESAADELKVEHRYYKKIDLALAREMERLVKDGTPVEDIVVLSPYSLEKSGLAGIERIAGHPLREAEPGADVEPGSLRVSTVGRFKGLESKVVIMVNVDAMDGARSESRLYVGMTRARALLILLITDTSQARRVWEPRFQEMARRAASSTGGRPGRTA